MIHSLLETEFQDCLTQGQDEDHLSPRSQLHASNKTNAVPLSNMGTFTQEATEAKFSRKVAL